MSANAVDLLFLVFFSGVLATIAGVGIFALPWKDDELRDTAQALREGWSWLDGALQRATAQVTHGVRHGVGHGVRRVSTASVRVIRIEGFDRPTTAFDGPTAPHAA